MLQIINTRHELLYKGMDYLPSAKKRILDGELIAGSAVLKPFAVAGKWKDRVVHCQNRCMKNALELKTPTNKERKR